MLTLNRSSTLITVIAAIHNLKKDGLELKAIAHQNYLKIVKVNDRFSKLSQFNTSGLGCWLSIILTVLILSSVGLGWVVNSIAILIALLFITPVVAFIGFQWWLKRKLIKDECPVCNYEFTGFKNTEFNCPSCGETLQVDSERFSRSTPPGTIDVDAVEVSVRTIEESND